MSIKHVFFGEISNEVTDYEVVWEGYLSCGQREIPVELWLGEGDELSEKKLDDFVVLLDNFSNKERDVRDGILSYLQNIDDSCFLKIVKNKATYTLSSFVENLEVVGVSLWYTSEQGETSAMIADYEFLSNENEEVLAVHFNLDGSIAEIAWES